MNYLEVTVLKVLLINETRAFYLAICSIQLTVYCDRLVTLQCKHEARKSKPMSAVRGRKFFFHFSRKILLALKLNSSAVAFVIACWQFEFDESEEIPIHKFQFGLNALTHHLRPTLSIFGLRQANSPHSFWVGTKRTQPILIYFLKFTNDSKSS